MCIRKEDTFYSDINNFPLQLLILAIISCSSANHLNLNTELLPPANVVNVHLNTVLLPPANVANVPLNTDLLPPANVANVFHDSGITFVSPSVRQLVISSEVLPQTITHAFGFIDTSGDSSHQFVRTHSSQPVSHTVESSVAALRSPIGIQSNLNGPVPLNVRRNEHPATHVMQARYMHRPEKPIAKHTVYGVPTQDEISLLPVFQNDKFLSPIVRHTNTPTHSNSAPIAQTIESIFDTSFQHNPTRRADNSHFS